MNQVITVQQAKQITRGRTPLVPVEYETALNALEACISLDEAKYWSDKADALAAWAKIYRSNDAELKSKRLKLHAYRRMGILAKELQPGGHLAGARGTKPGPHSLLLNNGLTHSQALAARALSKVPEDKFKELVARSKPPAPTSATGFTRKTDAWLLLTGKANGVSSGYSLLGFKGFCTKHSAKDLARSLSAMEAETAKACANSIIEWMDEFEQNLPK